MNGHQLSCHTRLRHAYEDDTREPSSTSISAFDIPMAFSPRHRRYSTVRVTDDELVVVVLVKTLKNKNKRSLAAGPRKQVNEQVSDIWDENFTKKHSPFQWFVFVFMGILWWGERIWVSLYFLDIRRKLLLSTWKDFFLNLFFAVVKNRMRIQNNYIIAMITIRESLSWQQDATQVKTSVFFPRLGQRQSAAAGHSFVEPKCEVASLLTQRWRAT